MIVLQPFLMEVLAVVVIVAISGGCAAALTPGKS
jgi:hypothetical protein